jgi:hypothetical protein
MRATCNVIKHGFHSFSNHRFLLSFTTCAKNGYEVFGKSAAQEFADERAGDFS